MRSTHSLNSNTGSPARCRCEPFFFFLSRWSVASRRSTVQRTSVHKDGVEKVEEREEAARERKIWLVCMSSVSARLFARLVLLSLPLLLLLPPPALFALYTLFRRRTPPASRIVDRVEYRSLQMRFAAAANESTPGLSGSLSVCSISREKLSK